jgi:hypothetical protein
VSESDPIRSSPADLEAWLEAELESLRRQLPPAISKQLVRDLIGNGSGQNTTFVTHASSRMREIIRDVAARHGSSSMDLNVMGTIGLAMPPMRMSVEGSAQKGHMPVNTTAQILLLVLMWLIVMAAPIAVQESKLPAEIQQTLDDYFGLIAGLAVSITFLIAPKLMKKTGKK